MTKVEFCKALNAIIKYNQEVDKVSKVLNCEIFESALCESAAFVCDYLVNALAGYNDQVIDDINWWLYEDVNKVWKYGDKEVIVKTPEQLYDALHELRYI